MQEEFGETYDVDALESFHKKFALTMLEKPGDVILIRSDNAWLSRIYQALCLPSFGFKRGGWREIPSHALIVVTPGLYLHAVPGAGVTHFRAEDYNFRSAKMVAVFRRQLEDGESAEDYQKRIADAAAWHHSQRYNYKINLTLWQRSYYSHSYCSQLVAAIYEQAETPLLSRRPRAVLPIHLAKEFSSGKWSDVTTEHDKFMTLLSSEDADKSILNTERDLAELNLTIAHDATLAVRRMEDFIRLKKAIDTFQRIGASLFAHPARFYRKIRGIPAPDMSIDINVFVAPLRFVRFPEVAVSRHLRTWLAENKRRLSRQAERDRRDYMQICEMALAYTSAVGVYLDQCIIENVQLSPKLMAAIQFDNAFITAIKQHEFVPLKRKDLPDANRDLHYIWSAAAISIMELHAIRARLESGISTLGSLKQDLNINQRFASRWLIVDMPDSSLKAVKRTGQKFLKILGSPKFHL